MHKTYWTRTRKLAWILGMLFACLCFAAGAQSATDAPWQGVWSGTIGKSEVRVCLSDKGKSAYRYLRYQTDIPLTLHGSQWEETVSGAVSGIWMLGNPQSDTLEGEWRNPKSGKTLPIRLNRLADANSSAPCESKAYLSELSRGPLGASPSGLMRNANAISSKRSEYVYVANYDDKTISAYSINADTGELAVVAGGDFKTGHSPLSITVSPAGTVVYVLNDKNMDAWATVNSHIQNSVNNTISAYRIQAATGKLTPVGHDVLTGFDANSVSINPAGTFAYVTYKGDTSVDAYRIDQTTGVLTPVKKDSFEAGNGPDFVMFKPTGDFAYVNNIGDSTISAYRTNQTKGSFVPIPHSQFDGGTFAAINPAGTFIYVVRNSNILVYRVNQTTGALLKVSAIQSRVVSPLSINHEGTFAYAFVDDSIIAVFRINQTTGDLTPVTDGRFDTGYSYSSANDHRPPLEIDQTDSFAYRITNLGDKVAAYHINSHTGRLSLLNGNPYSTGKMPRGVVVNPSGTFAYVLNKGDGTVSVYHIDQTTGALSKIVGSPFSAGINPISITLNPAGTVAYLSNAIVGNSCDCTVSAYRIDQVTGALAPVKGGPFLKSDDFNSIAINRAGTFAYVAGGYRGNVWAYRIDKTTGMFTPIPGKPVTTDFNLTSVAINPAGTFLYTVNEGYGSDPHKIGTVSAYRINSATGELTPVAGSPYKAGLNPKFATVNMAGTFLYVLNEGAVGDVIQRRRTFVGGSISVYRINNAKGTLTQIEGSPFSAGDLPTSIAINTAGTIVYVTHATGGVSAFRIAATTGRLAEAAGSPFFTGNDPMSVTLNPAGTLAFVANEGDSTVTVYYVDVSTGVLTPNGGPYATGKGSGALTIVQP